MPIDPLIPEDGSHQAETIAVNPAAGDSEDAISALNCTAIDHGVGFHHGQAEARQVVAAWAVEARHFSGFTAQQGAAALLASRGDALHHFGHGCGAELACGYVIKEKQGLCAAGDHVVDAHRHQVDAHVVVPPMGLGQFEFGANPIGACHQQGLPQAGRQSAEAAEPSQPAHNFGATGGLHAGSNPIHKCPACGHVHPCRAVIHAIEAHRALVPDPLTPPQPSPWTTRRSAHIPISCADPGHLGC